MIASYLYESVRQWNREFEWWLAIDMEGGIMLQKEVSYRINAHEVQC
jgi:hypothetical protein